MSDPSSVSLIPSAPQGDIENVAQMQPRDLTNLFELVSGSAAYRQQVGGCSTRGWRIAGSSGGEPFASTLRLN